MLILLHSPLHPSKRHRLDISLVWNLDAKIQLRKMDELNLNHLSLSVWNENGSILGPQEGAYSFQLFRSKGPQGCELPKISGAKNDWAYLEKTDSVLRKIL